MGSALIEDSVAPQSKNETSILRLHIFLLCKIKVGNGSTLGIHTFLLIMGYAHFLAQIVFAYQICIHVHETLLDLAPLDIN